MPGDHEDVAGAVVRVEVGAVVEVAVRGPGPGDRLRDLVHREFVHRSEHQYALSPMSRFEQRAVVEQRFDVVGLLDLAEAHPPRAGPHEHARPDHAGVHVEPVQVAQLDSGELAVGGADIVLAHEVGQAGHAGQAGELLKDHVREDDPRDVHLARARAWPSPSPARRPAGSRGRAHCRRGSRPTPARGRSRRRRRASSPPASPAPVRPARSGRCRARRTHTRTSASRSGAATHSPGGRPSGEESEGLSRVRESNAAWRSPRRCCPAVRAVARRARRRTSCCRTCRASRRAAPCPRRSPSGRTACRAPQPVGLQPPHPGNRDVGLLADQPDHLELVVHAVRREHRHVLRGGRDPRHPLLFPCAWPSSSQRPVRMIVSDDMPLASTPLSTVISGAAPPGITVDSHRDITAGSVLTSRLECWSRLTSSTAGSVGMRILPSAAAITIRWVAL